MTMTTGAHALGRLYHPDARDQQFPMRFVIPAATPDIPHRYWWPGGWWGDQGAEPQCVAYAWLHWLADGPDTSRTIARRGRGVQPYVPARELYCMAQTLDPWPGDCTSPRHQQYDGTSVRAGATALRQLGFIEIYWWA
jgi:hypothetical protein